jgi:hypothetical protein
MKQDELETAEGSERHFPPPLYDVPHPLAQVLAGSDEFAICGVLILGLIAVSPLLLAWLACKWIRGRRPTR